MYLAFPPRPAHRDAALDAQLLLRRPGQGVEPNVVLSVAQSPMSSQLKDQADILLHTS